jgi:hypothetical protein
MYFFQKNVLAWWAFLADQSFFNLLQVEMSWDEEAEMERAIGILVIIKIFEDILLTNFTKTCGAKIRFFLLKTTFSKKLTTSSSLKT